MARTGRTTKLTPQIQESIVRAVTAGAPYYQACLLAGVGTTTASEWLERGEGRHPTRSCTPQLASFAAAITHAKASDEIRRIARIDAAARGGAIIHEKTTRFPDGRVVTETQRAAPDWRADAFHLERCYSDRWGKRMQADLRLQIDQMVREVAAEVGVTPEALIAEAEAMLREHDQRHR